MLKRLANLSKLDLMTIFWKFHGFFELMSMTATSFLPLVQEPKEDGIHPTLLISKYLAARQMVHDLTILVDKLVEISM